ncbi:MAG: NADH-quinone oxidoreductase subunit NuoN [Kangiellaceae bacterium]|jgi:NADH-quinone oxidoreductase subunit N|nr:NADH-quinone oxidoreductase subunit NuoN [Kangiellaceae bacterium]
MSFIQLKPLLPEILMLVLGCLVLLVDLYSKDREKQSCYILSQIGLIIILLILINQTVTSRTVLYNGTFIVDGLARLLKAAIILISSVALIYARVFIRGRRFLRGEYYSLTIFAVLGMMVMVSAGHMLTLYLGLELLSLSLYAMIAMERDNSLGSEAAVKYFVTGAIASGFLLYGISLLYGVTGHLQIDAIGAALETAQDSNLARFSLMFIVVALAFKFGLVPFHMWLPDVYQGAPTSVTAFVASAPKIAAFGFAIRMLVEGNFVLQTDWRDFLLVTGLMSVVAGNIIALAQQQIKRLLAYSGIAHMGYFILGFYAGNDGGYAASLFYILIYALMTLAGFGMVMFMSRSGFECENIDDFKGLGKKNPWYAILLTLVMLSMAGIPPLIGFWPKLEIFRSLIEAGYWQLSLFAILFSVVGLFYYLRVVKVAYFDEPEKDFVFLPSRSIRFTVTFHCLALLILGAMPDSIYYYCLSAFN